MKILFNADDLPDKVDKIIELNKKERAFLKDPRAGRRGTGRSYQYVLTDKDWSVGVLSSVASRICSEERPVALVAAVGDIMRGPSGCLPEAICRHTQTLARCRTRGEATVSPRASA